MIGLFGFNLVGAVLGGLSRFVYVAVGWAALYQAANWQRVYRR